MISYIYFKANTSPDEYSSGYLLIYTITQENIFPRICVTYIILFLNNIVQCKYYFLGEYLSNLSRLPLKLLFFPISEYILIYGNYCT